MSKQFNIKGASQMYKLLDGLPLMLKANALKSVHRKALNEIIKKNLPSEHKKKWSVGNDPKDKTGVLGGFKSKNAYWLRFIEYGTKKRANLGRTRKGTVKGRKGNRGIMPADPFFNPLLDAEADNVVSYISENYFMLIQKFLERKVKAVNRAASKRI